MTIARSLACAALALAMAGCGSDAVQRKALPAEEEVRFERVTRFDGEVLRVALVREDGTRDAFNSVRDEWYSWSWVPARPGYAGRRWTLLKTTAEQSSMVYAVVSWNDDDPTDYLAAGWWLRFPGQYSFRRHLSLLDAEGDAFIDGPELDISTPPRLPEAGTATWTGGAGGFFRYRYGSGWTDVEAPVDVEEFTGTVAITADFADQTVRGCIGCVGDLVLEREHLYGALGYRRGVPRALPTDYELHFGATDIYSNGAFVGDEVTVTHPERTVTGSSGSWDGRLSNRPDADGNPRLVAGSAAVEFVEADGSAGEFRSLFTAVGESLLPPASNPNP